MKDLFEKNDNSELVMNAVVGLLQDACTTELGVQLTKESGVLKTMIEALMVIFDIFAHKHLNISLEHIISPI